MHIALPLIFYHKLNSVLGRRLMIKTTPDKESLNLGYQNL